MALIPMSDRVLIRPIKIEETTKSGLILSDTASIDMTQQAEVVSIGPGKRGYAGDYIPVELEVGQKILFVRDTGLKIRVDGEDLLLIQEEAILGKIKEEV